MSYIYIFGKRTDLTKEAEELRGTISCSWAKISQTAENLSRAGELSFTTTGKVGIDAMRCIAGRLGQKPKHADPQKVEDEGPTFVTTFREVECGRLYGSRVVVRDDTRRMGLHKEGHTSDPPTDRPVKVQRFPEPFAKDQEGYAHFCVRILQILAPVVGESPTMTLNSDQELGVPLESLDSGNGNGHKSQATTCPTPHESGESAIEKFRRRFGESGTSGDVAERKLGNVFGSLAELKRVCAVGADPGHINVSSHRGERVAGTRKRKASAPRG